MLARSAVRRQRRQTARILAASFAQLNLPWLAPAQLRWQATQAAIASQAPPPPRRRCSTGTKAGASKSRGLATATDQYAPHNSSQYPPPAYSSAFRNPTLDRYIPWDSSPSSESRLTRLPPREEPIMLHTPTSAPNPMIKVLHGVEGTAMELLQHLHTSLQIGRLQRAEAIIKKLAEWCSSGSAELIHAHIIYLEECQRRLALLGQGETSLAGLQAMQKWFEVEVRNKHVVLHEKLLVAMIRASIRALQGAQRARTVRRYIQMADELEEDAYFEVLESEDYDDVEFAILGRIVDELEEADQAILAESGREAPQDASEAQPGRDGSIPLQQIPEVLATEQRGLGLANVKRTLQALAEGSPLDKQEDPWERQRHVEDNAVAVAIDRWRKEDMELKKLGIHTAMQSRPINALMWQWYSAMLPALQAEIAECQKLMNEPGPSDNERYHYGPYLELLPPETLAVDTIIYVLSRLASGRSGAKREEGEAKLSGMAMGLAKTIEQDANMLSTKRMGKSAKHRSNARGSLKARAPQTQQGEGSGARRKPSKAEQRRLDLLSKLEWPSESKAKLGAFLISKLIESAQLPVTREHPRTKQKVTQLQPAFLHRTSFVQGKKLGIICANPALSEKLVSEPLGSLIAKRMPMIVEPKAWTAWDKGGYLQYSNPILRLSAGDKSGKDYFLAANKKGDMTQIYAGLTALGSVPWKIHKGVFKVQLEAWNSGEAIANFPPLQPDIEIPAEPPQSDTSARRIWLSEMRALENTRTGLHSQRCFQNFQLEIARTLVNETLYFPHSMDFRGRAYPIPPYLNHMGADNVRGLLVFAEGKELGSNGVRWLKIHLATVAGHDKASMAERLQFTEDHLEDIYDSARNPLNGRRWWLQAEDAWQTLAACFELTEALDSADPEKFVSHLPVQQDGTCNGLQHYAALGGDEIGAAQVNLEPSDRPADVYTAVAKAVIEEVSKDAAEGIAVAQKLNGRITRKCVKQPVMTNVYGVTFYGAKAQVRKQLVVLFPEVKRTDAVNLDAMALYIAVKIFKSLGEMFAGAQAIQRWLGICADRISTCLTPEQVSELTTKNASSDKQGSEDKKAARAPKKAYSRKKKTEDPAAVLQHEHTGSRAMEYQSSRLAKPLFKSTVVWTTPLRLPVVQPYRASSSRKVSTTLQRIQISDPQVWHPVSKRKQLQAFPPNFIHSLDATHMLLSALKCKEVGLTFASVHDSFWSHACDVNTLGTVLRDAFIEMHKDNVVGRLREEFQTRYKGCMYLASVLATSSAGKKITAFRKETKHAKKVESELAIEVDRLRLLESENPEERAKGEAMVTAGSILAAEGDEASLAAPEEINRNQLGTILNSPQEDGVSNQNSGASGEMDTDLLHAGDAFVEAADNDHLGDGVDAQRNSAEGETTSSTDVGAQASSNNAKPTTTLRRHKVFVWLPLIFPEIPPRGNFDVRKIRDSAYFFH